MDWELLSIIGTIAFAISGTFVAMEEKYDIFGVYILGMVTAFGGGAIRNVLLGIPVTALWNQELLFEIAIISILVTFLFPQRLSKYWPTWGTFFDAVGLGAFAIQGAQYGVKLGLPLSATIFAAILTGCGGGIIRDIFVSRKPLVFQSEMYALWAMLAGVLIGLGYVHTNVERALLLVAIVAMRLISLKYNWHLPAKGLNN